MHARGSWRVRRRIILGVLIYVVLAYLDLAASGQLLRRDVVPGAGPTANGRNGGGDRYETDGTLVVGTLRD